MEILHLAPTIQNKQKPKFCCSRRIISSLDTMGDYTGNKLGWISAYKRNISEVETTERKIFSSIKDEEIQNYLFELNRNRNESKNQTIKRVEGLRAIYYDIISKLQESHLPVDHQNFQLYLESFETKLSAFKLSMRNEFDIFEETETNLTDDINQFNSYVETWSNVSEISKINEVKSAAQKKRLQERQIRDLERKAIIGGMDKKIAIIGRTGTWDPRDHDIFNRIWNQLVDSTAITDSFNSTQTEEIVLSVNQRNAILKKAVVYVPGKKHSDVEEHIAWFLQFLFLTLSKKKIVQEWKSELLREKSKTNEDVLISEILDGKESIEDIQLNTSGTAGEHADEDKGASQEIERQAAKIRIAKWKADKAKQEEMEKIEKERSSLREKGEHDDEKRRRQALVRDQLEKWKESEEDHARVIALSNAKLLASRPKTVDSALRSRQAKDLEAAKVRLTKVDQAQAKKTEREKHIADARVNVLDGKEISRDVNRLWSDTKASHAGKITYEDLDDAERRRATGGAHSSRVAMTGRDLQMGGGRAVPNWCKPH